MSNNNTPQWWAPQPVLVQGYLVRHRARRFFRFLAVLAIAALTVVAVTANPGRDTLIGQQGQTTAPASLAALAAGCTGITTWPAGPASEVGARTKGEPLAYRYQVPVDGNFATAPWAGKAMVTTNDKDQPSISQAVALIYRDWTVVWYNPDADAKAVNEAIALGAANLDKVLVAPWPKNAALGGLLMTSPILITGWQTSQACEEVGPVVVTEFGKKTTAPGASLSLTDAAPMAKTNTYLAIAIERAKAGANR